MMLPCHAYNNDNTKAFKRKKNILPNLDKHYYLIIPTIKEKSRIYPHTSKLQPKLLLNYLKLLKYKEKNNIVISFFKK